MTVQELMNECRQLIVKGHGNKEVYISRDDEGNGYHQLFYTFITDEHDINDILSFALIDANPDPAEIVLLG